FELDVRVVSAMGAGGKMDPAAIAVADLYDTYECKLAFYIRKRIRRLGVKPGKILAVFSSEKPDKGSLMHTDGSNFKKSAYGTISYLPAAFGGVAASVVIRQLLGQEIRLSGKPVIRPARAGKKRNMN